MNAREAIGLPIEVIAGLLIMVSFVLSIAHEEKFDLVFLFGIMAAYMFAITGLMIW